MSKEIFKKPKTRVLSICRRLVLRLRELLRKERISYGSKICKNIFIVLALSRQICYYHAIEKPDTIANLRNSD